MDFDAYSSASETKATLTGDAFDAVAKALEAGSSDLANLAKTKVAGYVAPNSFIGNVMSTNPDGSVGISTISQWAYAVNLAEVGHRGTLYVPGVAVNGKSGMYFIHFKVVNVDVMKYNDDAFAAGKKSQYTLTCDVLSIEKVSDSVKLSVVFP